MIQELQSSCLYKFRPYRGLGGYSISPDSVVMPEIIKFCNEYGIEFSLSNLLNGGSEVYASANDLLSRLDILKFKVQPVVLEYIAENWIVDSTYEHKWCWSLDYFEEVKQDLDFTFIN